MTDCHLKANGELLQDFYKPKHRQLAMHNLSRYYGLRGISIICLRSHGPV